MGKRMIILAKMGETHLSDLVISVELYPRYSGENNDGHKHWNFNSVTLALVLIAM